MRLTRPVFVLTQRWDFCNTESWPAHLTPFLYRLVSCLKPDVVILPIFVSNNLEEGHVFVWGYGILGKGPNVMETAIPEMIPPSLFGLSDFNPDICVDRIRCGLNQFAAITSKYLGAKV